MRAAWLTLIALASGACGHARGPGASCGAAAARVSAVTEDALETAVDDGRGSAPAGSGADGRRGWIDAETRRAVTASLPAQRACLADVCARDRWAPGVRACLASAADHAAIEACEQGLDVAQRVGLEQVAASAPASP